MAGHAAAACKAPPPPPGSQLPKQDPLRPAGHQPSRPQPSEAEVQPEQAKALSQEVVQPKQEGLSLARSTALLHYDGESLPTITYPCKGLPIHTMTAMTAPFTTMDQGGCPVKARPTKRVAPILLPDYRPRAPAATVAAVDELPAAPPPPFPQMQ